jgi:hypothetical protein
MSEPGAFETIVAEVGKFLLPLRKALDSPAAFERLLMELGWNANAIPQPLRNLGPDVESLFNALQKIVAGGLSFDGSVTDEGASIDIDPQDVLRAIEAIKNVVEGIDAIASAPDAAFPATLIADGFKADFPEQLIGYLVDRYLRDFRPGIGFGLQALGITKIDYRAAQGNRPAYMDYRLDFSDIPKLFENPVVLFQNAFGWGTDQFDYRLLESKVDDLASALDRRVVMQDVPFTTAELLEAGADIPQGRLRRRTKIIFFERARNNGRLAAELGMFELPKSGALKPGFAFMPMFNGAMSLKLDLGPTVSVEITSDLDTQGGIALLFRPDREIEMVLGFDKPGTPVNAKGSGRVDVEFKRPDATPFPILGGATGTRLEVVSAGGATGFEVRSTGEVEVFAEIETGGLAFVLDPAGSDGFISKLLSGISTRMEFDLALGISHPRGVYFRGTSNLEIQVPAHINLGPIEVQGLTIALKPNGDGLPIDMGATFKAQLGPLAAVVENIGLRTNLSFPGQGGNLGPIDLSFAFKPPNGVGLSIDAGAVKGGGYLFIDPDRGEYAGALELSILEIVSVTALGVINTKMPDGSEGFSFIAIISVEFTPGIQLGFGFTLLGVGGLVGLNRSMNLDAIVAGLRAGGIDSILFPKNVIANAPRIISDLRSFFPPEAGTFLIGPMMKFGWGTPTLISLSIGVIIEIPGNIAIAGKLTVAIPDERVPLIIVQVVFIGAIEFDKKRGWFVAYLYESRVIFMPLDGGLGVLAAFGDDANFVVTVGGFHPTYKPPALPFPPIPRIAINILNTPVARIRVDAYFAVTSNTVQFGAKAELYFGISIASVEGHLGFDALFQFSPFYFIITISASLSVKLFGAGLFSVRFKGSLEGTSPWHVEGTGSISLLFWDVDVDFSHTWGDKEDTKLPPISVMPLLVAEFEKDQNWTAQLGNSSKLFVTLRSIDAGVELVLHPVGSLKVTQRAVPLGITLDKFGSQKPDDANRFEVAAATSGIDVRQTVKESFAIAQFQELSAADKLAAADFEKEEAGLELSSSGNQMNTSLCTKRVARYEQIIIDNAFKRAVVKFAVLAAGLFTHFLGGNAVARAEISAKNKDLRHLFDDKIKASPAGYVVVSLDDNAPIAGAPLSFASAASAREFVAAKSREVPGFADTAHIVRPHEMKQAA